MKPFTFSYLPVSETFLLTLKLQRPDIGLGIKMLEKTQKEKIWNNVVTQFQQNGGAVEHATGMFEVKPKTENENSITNIWEVSV